MQDYLKLNICESKINVNTVIGWEKMIIHVCGFIYISTYPFLVWICTKLLRSFSRWKDICVKKVKADMCDDLGSSAHTFYVETTPLLLPSLFHFRLELVMLYYKEIVVVVGCCRS